MLSVNESVREPRGDLHLKIYRAGVLLEDSVERNLIVDGAKTVLSRLVGGSFTNNQIAEIHFGTNGATPVTGNTTITDAFAKPISNVSFPGDSSVQFDFTLASGDANGKAIMEFGLVTAGGTLFSRKVRPVAINKESDLTITGSWILNF